MAHLATTRPDSTEPNSTAAATRAPGTPGDRPTVLLVEDDAWLRAVLAELLADEGYAVLEARDGPQGCRLAKYLRPDAVVLDLGLPSQSGLEVLEDLRHDERTRRTPVLLMTGSQDLAREASAHGRPVPVPKPLDLEDLLARLEQCHAA